MGPLKPSEELVGIHPAYHWNVLSPLRPASGERRIRSVWYIGLPLTSAHRGDHSGGGAPILGADGNDRYRNEGTVYPHASLVELITYHQRCFPSVPWRYLDVSHLDWDELQRLIADDPPDVAAFSTYTATYTWALLVAAAIKRANPRAVTVFGNDHASILRKEVLTGRYGSQLIDFVALGNNGPFTMMGLLNHLLGRLRLERVPSIAYRRNGRIVEQDGPNHPLIGRLLPDYRLIEDDLARHYDPAFAHWYAQHYELKRMITLPIDAGCQWGRNPKRRCKHCSIQGLTPKTAQVSDVVDRLEQVVGELSSNVYAAGDSTFGFSRDQWGGEFSFLDEIAEACAKSDVLRGRRFLLAYGLVSEFLVSAKLCSSFVRTWNVGLEAFNPRLLKNNSKGINQGTDQIHEALELAASLDYRLYASGILGLPGTTRQTLREEVDNWLALAEAYQPWVTAFSISSPGVIPGSRMYWDLYNDDAEMRAAHGEMIPCRKLTALFLRRFTEVTIEDVESAVNDVARGIMHLSKNGGNPVKFGGYMLGGVDESESTERRQLERFLAASPPEQVSYAV